MRKILRACSVVAWGAIGLFFGFGVALAGIQRMTGPAAVLTVAIGIAVIAAAFAMHRGTCWCIDRLISPRA